MAGRIVTALVIAAGLGAPPAAAAPSATVPCAAGANCSQGQKDGTSIGTNYGPINLNFGPPREQDGLYQAGKEIGQAWDVERSHSVLVFHGVALTAYPDPALPIEFGDLTLNCKSLPDGGERRHTPRVSVAIKGDVACEIVK